MIVSAQTWTKEYAPVRSSPAATRAPVLGSGDRKLATSANARSLPVQRYATTRTTWCYFPGGLHRGRPAAPCTGAFWRSSTEKHMSYDNHQVPIEIRGLTKLGSVRALDRLDTSPCARAQKCTASSAPTARASPTCASCSGSLVKADGGRAMRLLGGDPLDRHVIAPPHRLCSRRCHIVASLTGGGPTCWPACEAASTCSSRGTDRRFGLDPTKKARTYSQGNRQGLPDLGIVVARHSAALG